MNAATETKYYRYLQVSVLSVSVGLVSGCGGGGGGSPSVAGAEAEPAAVDRRSQAAQAIESYLASYADAPVGRANPRCFSATFTSDGFTGPDYTTRQFGNYDSARLTAGGIQLSRSTGGDSETLTIILCAVF